jgi:CelD/BcsL family acetyltransferase involved in cellulose biosynthesis
MDVVARRGLVEQVTTCFVAALANSSSTWDILDLHDMDSASPTLAALYRTFAQGEYVVHVSEQSVCPYEVFAHDESFESFSRRIKRRSTYRRRKNWLEKQPGYRVSIATEPEAVDRAFSHFLRLHSLRWQEDGGSQALSNPRLIAFHRDAARMLAEGGRVRIYTMEVGGRPVASVYGIVHNNTFHYYQSGRDPEWQEKSVGMVLVGETFKDSIELSLCAFDFLQGAEPFKADWASGVKHTVGVRIYKVNGIGRWLDRREWAIKAAKDYAKRVLPEHLVHRLRVWARAH